MAAEFAFNVYAISQSSLTLSACDEMCSVQLYVANFVYGLAEAGWLFSGF